MSTDWLRSIELLRDSFNGHFGPVHILAPSVPIDAAPSDAVLERADQLEDVELTPSIDLRIRTRHYWMTGRRQWLSDVRRLVAVADVVHGGFSDPIRPLMYDALKVAFEMDRPTVAYRDTDTLEQIRGTLKTARLRERAMLKVRAAIFARMARHVARSVDLLMLKGQSLMRWLGPYARCIRSFQDTSYLESEMASYPVVERRAGTQPYTSAESRLLRPLGRTKRACSVDRYDRSCLPPRGTTQFRCDRRWAAAAGARSDRQRARSGRPGPICWIVRVRAGAHRATGHV